MPSARAHINPQMVAWAREQLNVDREELARKVGTKPHIVEAWETAERRPTIKQLRKMARVLERPEGHFYLDEPPPESAPRLEMRRVFGGSPVEDTYAFAREVQRIQRRREIALDLFDLLSVATVREKGSAAFWDEAEVERLANRYRVSPAAIVRRLDRFDRIASGEFDALRQRFDDRRFEPPSTGGEGGGNFYNNQLTRLGSLLPELAFRAFYANQIGARELSAVMGTKVGNLSTFEEKVLGSTYAFADA